jgi:hypothetical protein
MHDTCSDGITWFDLDLMPATHHDDVRRTRQACEQATSLDAHERCRRFESAAFNLTPPEALAHVEARSVDLAQVRPELGHATNAVAVIGRRWRTRGLFLDRRSFLVSYDPTADATGDILARTLAAVGPVGAGINLEYFFSTVDRLGYGAGTKLPHNITGLIGVMDGHASDLRTGLPWQMVEIHEPVRLLMVIDATPADRALVLVGEGGGPLSTQWLSKAVKRRARACGLREALRLYDARGTAVTRLYRAGASIDQLATVFGWSAATAAQMLRHYAAMDPEASDDVLRLLACETPRETDAADTA